MIGRTARINDTPLVQFLALGEGSGGAATTTLLSGADCKNDWGG